MTRDEILQRVGQLDEIGLAAVEEVLRRQALVERQRRLLDEFAESMSEDDWAAFDAAVQRRPLRSEGSALDGSE